MQEARIEQAQIRHDFIDVHMALIEVFIKIKLHEKITIENHDKETNTYFNYSNIISLLLSLIEKEINVSLFDNFYNNADFQKYTINLHQTKKKRLVV